METALQMELDFAQRELKLVTAQYDEIDKKLSQISYEDQAEREKVAKHQGVALGQKLQLQEQIRFLESLLRTIRKSKKTA
jgi:flagellar biosynthesis chaperone FliJ